MKYSAPKKNDIGCVLNRHLGLLVLLGLAISTLAVVGLLALTQSTSRKNIGESSTVQTRSTSTTPLTQSEIWEMDVRRAKRTSFDSKYSELIPVFKIKNAHQLLLNQRRFVELDDYLAECTVPSEAMFLVKEMVRCGYYSAGILPNGDSVVDRENHCMLWFAIRARDAPLIRNLLAAGYNVESQVEDGESPLEFGRKMGFEYLFEQQFSPVGSKNSDEVSER